MSSELPNLGEGLLALIDRVGSPLRKAQDITSKPTHDPRRRTFHLWLEDGREMKGRYFATRRFGQVYMRIRHIERLDFLPTVIASSEDAILEEWIDGQTLRIGEVNEASITQCAMMLGRLHQAVPPGVDDLGFMPWTIEDWVQAMTISLMQLVGANVLPESSAQRLEATAMRHLPAKQRVGVVHRDLCPDNIVARRDGRCVPVDNGSLTIGSIEEDLCRTWYRWPMTGLERGAFASGYARFGDPSAFENPSMFWRIVVIANSARFRLAVSPAAFSGALERLRELL